MVIKSGEGVVYLTRPQKYFQSSPHPEGLTFFSPAPRTYVPRPTKTDAKSPNMAPILPKYGIDHSVLRSSSRYFVQGSWYTIIRKRKKLDICAQSCYNNYVEFKNKNRSY